MLKELDVVTLGGLVWVLWRFKLMNGCTALPTSMGNIVENILCTAMAQATDDLNANPTQAQQILEEVRELRQEVEQANQKNNEFNQKFDNYQKATQWVVQLAFSLIAAATVTVIVSTVLGR
jgi:uncharacterized protein YlxW (UPF0749 family)